MLDVDGPDLAGVERRAPHDRPVDAREPDQLQAGLRLADHVDVAFGRLGPPRLDGDVTEDPPRRGLDAEARREVLRAVDASPHLHDGIGIGPQGDDRRR